MCNIMNKSIASCLFIKYLEAGCFSCLCKNMYDIVFSIHDLRVS